MLESPPCTVRSVLSAVPHGPTRIAAFPGGVADLDTLRADVCSKRGVGWRRARDGRTGKADVPRWRGTTMALMLSKTYDRS